MHDGVKDYNFGDAILALELLFLEGWENA